jgi:hypothetical protein
MGEGHPSTPPPVRAKERGNRVTRGFTSHAVHNRPRTHGHEDRSTSNRWVREDRSATRRQAAHEEYEPERILHCCAPDSHGRAAPPARRQTGTRHNRGGLPLLPEGKQRRPVSLPTPGRRIHTEAKIHLNRLFPHTRTHQQRTNSTHKER